MKFKRYTVEEDAVILNAVKSNPHNLQEAFRIAEEKLGREATRSVEQRYYNILRGKYPMFTLEGSGKPISNTKVVREDTKYIRYADKQSPAQLAKLYKKLTRQEKVNFQVLIK